MSEKDLFYTFLLQWSFTCVLLDLGYSRLYIGPLMPIASVKVHRFLGIIVTWNILPWSALDPIINLLENWRNLKEQLEEPKRKGYWKQCRGEKSKSFSSIASKPINFRWIRTFSQSYWKIVYSINIKVKFPRYESYK